MESEGLQRDANVMYGQQENAYNNTFTSMVAVIDRITGEPNLAHQKHGPKTLVDPRVMIQWHNCQPAFTPVLFQRISTDAFYAMITENYIHPGCPVIFEIQKDTGSEFVFGISVVNHEEYSREKNLTVEEMMEEDWPANRQKRQGLKVGTPSNPGFTFKLGNPELRKEDWMNKDAKTRKAEFDTYIRNQQEQERLNNSGCSSWNVLDSSMTNYKHGPAIFIIVCTEVPEFIWTWMKSVGPKASEGRRVRYRI